MEGRTQLLTSINKHHLLPISFSLKILGKMKVVEVTCHGLFWASKVSPHMPSFPPKLMLLLQNLLLEVESSFNYFDCEEEVQKNMIQEQAAHWCQLEFSGKLKSR